MTTCPSCGESFDARPGCKCGHIAPDSPQAERPVLTAALPADGPRGVGGWLLLLCISLTVLTPLQVLVPLLQNIAALVTRSIQIPSVEVMALIDTIGWLTFAVLRVTAGVALWSVHSRGPLLARVALLAGIIVTGIAAATPRLTGATAYLDPEFVKDRDFAFAAALPFSFLWLAYLEKSKRVRATYDE